MALTVTTPASSTKLCQITDVMDELACSEEDQPTLDSIIQQVSDAIVAWCGRAFAKQTYQETVAGYGDVHMALSVYPIISVSQVLAQGSPVTDFTIQEPDSGLLYRAIGWRWSTIWAGKLNPQPWPQSEEQIFTVDYIAGYDLPDQLLPTLPGDIERAAIITVKDWFVNRKRNVRVKSVRVGSVATQYDDESAITPTAMKLLSTYRVTL